MTFVNISNHPSSGWSEDQRMACLRLASEIVDFLPLHVLPEGDLGYIERTATAIMERVPDEATYAMVVTEYTLTVLLVTALQRRGVTCLAATTRRDVRLDENGTRSSIFRFVRFREYPVIRVQDSGILPASHTEDA